MLFNPTRSFAFIALIALSNLAQAGGFPEMRIQCQAQDGRLTIKLFKPDSFNFFNRKQTLSVYDESRLPLFKKVYSGEFQEALCEDETNLELCTAYQSGEYSLRMYSSMTEQSDVLVVRSTGKKIPLSCRSN